MQDRRTPGLRGPVLITLQFGAQGLHDRMAAGGSVKTEGQTCCSMDFIQTCPRFMKCGSRGLLLGFAGRSSLEDQRGPGREAGWIWWRSPAESVCIPDC